MDEDGPLRLKQGGDTPADLVRALDALRKGADETPRLERVAAKLGPLLDAPPQGMSSTASGAGSASYKFTALKLIIGGLALLAPLPWLMHGKDSTEPREVARPNESATSAKQSAPSAEPALPAGTAHLREPVPADPNGAARTPPSAKAPARAARPKLEKARPVAAANPSPSSAATGDAPALGHGSSARNAEPSSPSPTRTQPSAAAADEPKADEPKADEPKADEPKAEEAKAEEAKAAAVKVRTPSEAELLFDARKAMSDDPALALRRLAEHAKHYPGGQFVPEREVLAIEALRSLGRTAEASARLQRFKARYPDSFHLQHLEH